MGNMAVLKRAKGYVFKLAPNPALADPRGPPFSLPVFENRVRKILKVASSLSFLSQGRSLEA